MAKLRVIGLTDEEIASLPFPETAKLLGGILLVEEGPIMIPKNKVKQFRKLFKQVIENSVAFKNPFEGTSTGVKFIQR